MKKRSIPSDDEATAVTPTADDVLDRLRLTGNLVRDLETVCADHERPDEGPFFSQVLVLHGLRQVLEGRMREALEFDSERARPFCVMIVETLDQLVAHRRTH